MYIISIFLHEMPKSVKDINSYMMFRQMSVMKWKVWFILVFEKENQNVEKMSRISIFYVKKAVEDITSNTMFT